MDRCVSIYLVRSCRHVRRFNVAASSHGFFLQASFPRASYLADSVGLPCFPLKRMLLVLEMGIVVLGFAARGVVFIDMFRVLRNGLGIHLLQGFQGKLDVRNERVAS